MSVPSSEILLTELHLQLLVGRNGLFHLVETAVALYDGIAFEVKVKLVDTCLPMYCHLYIDIALLYLGTINMSKEKVTELELIFCRSRLPFLSN
jgi:hypothetical protein